MASPAIVLLVLLVCACGVSARTLYVAADGVNTTCTQELPCSLTTACGEVEAFDLIQLLAGQYALVDSPCEIGVASVDVVGEEGSELTCTGSCFVFSESPFTISSLSLASADDTESDALIVSDGLQPDGLSATKLSNIGAQLQSSNFMDLTISGFAGNQNTSITLENISVSGTCSQDPYSGSCIAITSSTPTVVAITDCIFTDIITNSSQPLIGGSTLVLDRLSLERLTFSQLSVAALCAQEATFTRLEDITVMDVTAYQKGFSPMITVRGDLVVIQNLSFMNVEEYYGLFLAVSYDLVAENLYVDECLGLGNASPLTFSSSPGPEVVTHTVFGLSVTNSDFPFGISGAYGNYNGTLVLNDVSVSNVTFLFEAFASSRGKFVLSEFTADGIDSYYLIDARAPRLITVVKGNITNSKFGSTMFRAHDGDEAAKMLFKDIDTDEVNTPEFFLLETGDAVWQLNVTDCVFDTDSNVAVKSIVECVPTDSDASNTVVTVVSSPCDLGNTCDLSVADGYNAGDSCTMDIDDSSSCPACGEENSSKDSGDSPQYWWIALVVLALVAVVVFIVAVVAGAGVYIAKKKQHDDYDMI